MAEIDPKAPGLRLAKRYGIPVTRNFRDLLSSEEVDLIIDRQETTEPVRELLLSRGLRHGRDDVRRVRRARVDAEAAGR